MNRKEAAELLPIIQAYAEGKTILVKDKRLSDEEDNWNEANDCSFDIEKIDYRIKSESTYRPFEDEKECWTEMKKHQPFGWVKTESDTHRLIVLIGKERLMMGAQNTNWSYRTMFKEFSFADGLPFGVKVEEQLWRY